MKNFIGTMVFVVFTIVAVYLFIMGIYCAGPHDSICFSQFHPIIATFVSSVALAIVGFIIVD